MSVIGCEQSMVQLQALPDYMSELIFAFYSNAALLAKAPCEIGVFDDPAQGVGQLGGLFGLHKEAVDAVGDNILASAHARGYAGQATCHSLQ